jgi:hypothetical protein
MFEIGSRREIKAVELCLLSFKDVLKGSSVCVFYSLGIHTV